MKLKNQLDKINFINNQIFKKKNYYIYFILALSLLSSIFELIGIGLAFPAIAAIISENVLNEYQSKFFILNYLKGDLSNNDFIVLLFILIIVVYTAKFLILLLNKYAVSKAIFSLDKKISSKLFFNYLNCDFEYVTKVGFSEIVKNIYNQSRAFTAGFLMCILNIFLELTTFTVVIFFLFILNFKITFTVIFFSIIIMATYLLIFKNRVLKLGLDRVFFEKKKYQHIYEGVKGIKDIILFNKKKFFSNLLYKRNEQLENVGVSHAVYSALPQLLFEFISILIFCFITIGLFLSNTDNQNILLLITLFGFCLIRILPSIVKVVSNYQNLIYYYPSLNDIYNSLTETKLKKVIFTENPEIYEFKHNLILKNISFNRGDNQILKNIDFEINPGAKVGIIGESGSGKTTFLNILMGLLHQDSGNIFCDGKEVLNKNNLNFINLFGHVPSDTFLFEGSFFENISLQNKDNLQNKESVIYDKVIKASKAAKIHDFIQKKEKKYDSECGSDGSNISAGQKQRVAIARAIFKEPKILVFDESTNFLDKKTENDILSEIFNDLNNHTIIFASHNIQILEKFCNEIYKIEDSKIIKYK